MKDVEVKLTDYRPAYYFRKGVMEQKEKKHLRERIKKVSNRSLMYGVIFSNRVN